MSEYQVYKQTDSGNVTQAYLLIVYSFGILSDFVSINVHVLSGGLLFLLLKIK